MEVPGLVMVAPVVIAALHACSFRHLAYFAMLVRDIYTQEHIDVLAHICTYRHRRAHDARFMHKYHHP